MASSELALNSYGSCATAGSDDVVLLLVAKSRGSTALLSTLFNAVLELGSSVRDTSTTAEPALRPPEWSLAVGCLSDEDEVVRSFTINKFNQSINSRLWRRKYL